MYHFIKILEDYSVVVIKTEGEMAAHELPILLSAKGLKTVQSYNLQADQVLDPKKHEALIELATAAFKEYHGSFAWGKRRK
jgi:hypothetical protein